MSYSGVARDVLLQKFRDLLSHGMLHASCALACLLLALPGVSSKLPLRLLPAGWVPLLVAASNCLHPHQVTATLASVPFCPCRVTSSIRSSVQVA